MLLNEQNIQFIHGLFQEDNKEVVPFTNWVDNEYAQRNASLAQAAAEKAKQSQETHGSGFVDTLKHHVANITGKVTNTAQHAKEYVTGAGQKVAQHVGTAAQHAKEYAGAGAHHLTDTVSHHPVAAGVLGAAGLYGAHKATGG
jgi:hypothetical protein